MNRLPLLLLLLLFILSFSAEGIEQLIGVSATETDLFNRFAPAGYPHLLGTDELGRDVFIRLLYGGKISLIVGMTAALAAAALGTLIGMTAGYAGGRWDAFAMRATDLMIALPLLPLLMILSAIDLEKLGIVDSENASLYKIILLISLFGWTTVARLSRARALTLRIMDFVTAARALGLGHARILFRHVLPNLINTVITATTLSIGNIILLESVLSFLGLGIQPPMTSWGNMLSNAQENIWENGTLAVYPGLMIFMTVLAFNFLGDELQKRR